MSQRHIIIAVIAVALLSGCATNVPSATEAASATMPTVGFWYGVWHGVIAMWAFLFSLFDDSYAIYAVYNNGTWYNFGFVIGLAISFESMSTCVRKSRHEE